MTWTADEIVVLRRSYGTKNNAWIAERLGKSETAIASKASDLALAKDKRRFKGRKMPQWNSVEVATLRRLYPVHANVDIAHALGRSLKSITSKGCPLGLRKDSQRLREMGQENVVKRRDRAKP